MKIKHYLLFAVHLLYILPGYAFLSAHTSEVIRGNVPQLNAILEQEIIDKQFSLLNFQYLNINYDHSNIDEFPPLNPRQLISDFLQQVEVKVGILKEYDALDIDGDSNFKLQPELVKLNIRNKDNQIISLKNSSFCDMAEQAPFSLHISTDLALTTQYGIPNSKSYHAVESIYPLKITPSICYLKPNLMFDHNEYLGKPTVWREDHGFFPQSDTNPTINFPTTGMDNLDFDIKTIGLDVKKEIWKVNYPHLSSINVSLTIKDNNTLNVKLSGPNADKPDAFQASAAVISNNSISYSFVIKDWFIHNYDKRLAWSEANGWCNALGGQKKYKLPTIEKLSNGLKNINSTSEFRYYDYYRAIGGGLLSEWGSLLGYKDTGILTSGYIWSATPSNIGYHYDALNSSGFVSAPTDRFAEKSMCISQ